MITDPFFYMLAVPAVFLFGVSKSGFGGGLGIVAVPMMALAVSPIQAAVILLPILCLIDVFSVWAWRGQWLWRELKILLPASLIGVALGALLFEYMSSSMVRLALGLIAISFSIHHWVRNRISSGEAQATLNPIVGIAAAVTGGFTSFIAHSGGPPVSMYLLRRNIDRSSFAATTVYLFFVINLVKLIPYSWLGQFEISTFMTSLVLAPRAPIGVYTSVLLHQQVSDELFFKIAYGVLFLVGVKLSWDGIAALLLNV